MLLQSNDGVRPGTGAMPFFRMYGCTGRIRRVEPEPQEVAPAVFLRVAVIERGARVQDRVVVDEIHLARAAA